MSLNYSSNNGVLVTSLDELPDFAEQLAGSEPLELFLDTETTSFNSQIKSTEPWHDCFVLGIAIKLNNSRAYYIPVNHATKPEDKLQNLDALKVQAWLKGLLVKLQEREAKWINHNVKYDCQVLYARFGVDMDLEMHCTLDLAKLIDSDRYHHSLDALSKDWLKEDISKFNKAFAPYLENNKDYGVIPMDLMGEYACQDVITEARLWKFISANIPPESRGVAKTSSECLQVLVEIERNGMRIDPSQVALAELKSLNRMVMIQQEIMQIIGYTIEPHVNKDCFDVLCNKYGLPVLDWTDTGNPSFDKEAINAYKALPGAPVEVLDLMLEYRSLQTFTSLFTATFRRLHIKGLLHSSYKQTVRTGRMSCSTPNQQQNSKMSKELIICNDDEVLIAADYSQIEFRIIVHYIQDSAAIAAYGLNPWTDFHLWVSEVCHVHRKPAKTINFLMGYGGGKDKLISKLVQIPELVGDLQKSIEQRVDLNPEQKLLLFETLAKTRGLSVYTTYHDTLPGLKRTTRQATNRVYERGYCVNKYGRRRHLSKEGAHRAFNSVCQGTAADLMKERLVALNKFLKKYFPMFVLIGVVHDEVIIRGPKRCVTKFLLDAICYILEDIQTELRVPIRTSLGISTKNWLLASSGGKERKFDRVEFKTIFEEFVANATA